MDRQTFVEAERLPVGEETKSRLEEQKKEAFPIIKIKLSAKAMLPQVMSSLKKLKESELKGLFFHVCVPSHMMDTARELNRKAFLIRTDARDNGKRTATNLRWRKNELALYIRPEGESKYKLYHE